MWLWIFTVAVLAAAVYLFTRSVNRGRPGWLVWGLLLLGVGILLGTLALLDTV
jgi:hypothetical protein